MDDHGRDSLMFQIVIIRGKRVWIDIELDDEEALDIVRLVVEKIRTQAFDDRGKDSDA